MHVIAYNNIGKYNLDFRLIRSIFIWFNRIKEEVTKINLTRPQTKKEALMFQWSSKKDTIAYKKSMENAFLLQDSKRTEDYELNFLKEKLLVAI